MSNKPVAYKNTLAQDFADLKKGAQLTPRLALDRLSAGTPPLDDETWRLLQVMMTKSDKLTPDTGPGRQPNSSRRASPPGTSRRCRSNRHRRCACRMSSSGTRMRALPPP